jgi:hypothetical protein
MIEVVVVVVVLCDVSQWCTERKCNCNPDLISSMR